MRALRGEQAELAQDVRLVRMHQLKRPLQKDTEKGSVCGDTYYHKQSLSLCPFATVCLGMFW